MPLTPPPAAPPAAPVAPGDAPSRANPATFRSLADAFVVWQVGFRTSLASLVTWLTSYISWAATNVSELDALQTDVTTKAAAAADSATAAAGSASASATSAADAAATLDAFDDRYLGAKALAPTTDNDGNPLVTGALYFNTVTPGLFVWNGADWQVTANLAPSGFIATLLDDANATTARATLGAAALNGSGAEPFSVASLNGGQLAGLRNKIINGNPLINQRGASSASTVYAAGVYFLDRWKAGAADATVSFSTVNNVTTITVTAGSIIQVVEGLNLQSGTYALSWTGTAQGKIGAGAYSASGVNGSITGGTNTNVEFNTGTVSLVQLEFGITATPFEHRPYGAELALCQRYLPAVTADNGDVASGVTVNPSSAVVNFTFVVTPCVAPTGVTSAGIATLTTGTASSAVTALTFASAGLRTARITVTGTGTPYLANQPAILVGTPLTLLFTGCEL